ncbi:helix-turn-helix domain-containing protein [Aquimarina gracilis]|uniref:Helix-turn-helix domain-containing protein n=1 Tax=Aquimarina gracilis TaxID=874422 RepID=A0ABU6A1U5_9FLAO|nr:helix-turn-helix domain-containing protein [Aquimarina gracilis]MEB3348020.1 helix-turn-helix domain-containing protein [Aquimarina gracilis]
MYKVFVYCFFIKALLFSSITNAQNFKDSIKGKSFDELYNVYNQYKNKENSKAEIAIIEYIAKAKKKGDTLKLMNGFLKYSYITDLENRLKYYDSIISFTKNNPIGDHPASVFFLRAKHFLYEERNIEKTIDNLTEARKYASANNNTNQLYGINYLMGIVKSEHLNEKEEAISIFKDCAQFYAKETEEIHKYQYLFTLHVLAETYIGLKKQDSATFYNNLGYKKASSSSSDLNMMKAYFSLCEGINQYTKQRYSATIDSINKAVSTLILVGDKANTIDSYFYLGKSHYDLGDKETAIVYFKKTDSILETLTSIPQYKHVKTYEYLKDYYKSNNDLQNQNKYLDKLNSLLDNYLNDKIFISTKVKEDYDVPLLLEEQQVLITQLSKNTNTYLYSITILALLLLTSGSLVYYQYRKKQGYRLRFEKLMEEQKTNSKSDPVKATKAVDTEKVLKVPEKHVNYILEKLDVFEKERKYLTVGLSSQSLADDIETNVKYLSRVINHFKNKTFTNYVNELRIDHAVHELKENTTLQKFTIKAIAQEMGYSSAETFSNAFYRQVGIKPSYFIKQLEKTKKDKKNTDH